MGKEKLWGFIDKKGEIVIAPRFHDAGDFSEGLAWVKIDYQRGYINREGEFVIPPQFEKAGDFHNGMARVKIDDEWFYIDLEGNRVHGEFEDLFRTEKSEAGLKPELKDGKYGYVDETGAFIIPPKYVEASPFSEGVARVKTSQTGKWGFIDQGGKAPFKSKFIEAGDFHEGLARVLLAI